METNTTSTTAVLPLNDVLLQNTFMTFGVFFKNVDNCILHCSTYFERWSQAVTLTPTYCCTVYIIYFL